MKIALCGFEGVGKSFLTEEFHKKDFFKVKESARFLINLKNSGWLDKNNLSMSAFISNLKSLETTYDNNIENAIFDRSILDDFVYLNIYGNQKIELKTFQKIVDNFKEKHNCDYIYDKIILLKHSKDANHIKKNVLTDKERIYGKDVDQYKEVSHAWEKKFLKSSKKIKGLTKELKVIESYPDNVDLIKSILG